MRGALRLAWRYLTWHWGRSTILVICIALTLLLPFGVTMLVNIYEDQLRARADATPFVVGTPGSRYDLVLSSLYFRGAVRRPSSMAEVAEAGKDGYALVMPLHVGYTAAKRPLVGCTHDYYRFRGLTPAAGRWPRMPGECVLGAEAAAQLELAPGSKVMTNQENVYDFGLAYPLRLHVVGVLAPTGTADDRVLFTDLKTIWIMAGLGHGHDDVDALDPKSRGTKADGVQALNSRTHLFTEITGENIDTFHFHGKPEDFPITGMLLEPRDARAATFLKGRYATSASGQLLVPREVVDELVEFVFQLKAFFDANVILVSLATALFLALVVLLSLRVRRGEIETLTKIGCARRTVFRMISLELAIVILVGAAVAGVTAWAATTWWLGDLLA